MTEVQLTVAKDERELARIAADVVTKLIDARPTAVLALPTGRTPVPLYEELAARFRAGEIDFSGVTVFNLDEWAGLGAGDPASYASFMDKYFYSRVNLPASQRFIPDGRAEDLDAECLRYETAIDAAGGIDLAILGIGRNGHIGFNEPGTPFNLRTRVAEVTPSTRRANAYAFVDGQPPYQAITVGIATILAAREILLLASGSAKAEVLARALRGPIDPAVPASVLQTHPSVRVVADEPAVALVAAR